ncbi:LysR family transcriptional regulator [Diaphorobacter aerolatus]|uniref:LysR family transcriptional regulator n=1 Tax=Diaphorobacter aerolatus TaxID=1288495 RepID=A0A7H0GQF9_9BURK|nr:LysR family transcriptional regulator [Diaphorobacter aerolatus]QNP50525.1 LysR family transcriptional regulator [Diaphorobacter aerolatus]
MAERNLTRAAANLSITQPAVSNALRRLRELLGDELLLRKGHGVEPTAHAVAIWPVVRQSLEMLQQSLLPDSFNPATTNITFVLAMADSTVATLIPPLIEIVEREAPGLALRIMPLINRDPRHLLDEAAVDLAVGYFPSVLADLTAQAQSGTLPEYETRRLYDGEYVAVMRKGHALADHPLTLDEYCSSRHLLVSFSGQGWGFIDEALALLGRQRRISLTVNQYSTAARVVAHSDMVTVLPRHFIPLTGIADQLHQQPLPLDVTAVHVAALWQRRGRHQAATAWLLGVFQRVAQSLAV